MQNKEKTVLHLITHSHWDREWYMPFERHRMRLVELVDSILETLDNNPNFKYFHFDGQVVPIEDYLEIRPQMKDKLLKYIKEERIFIGPWYVLQDEYLISSEANVRNMLLGIREAKRYGDPLMVGYFPDSFGNISQSPQILRGFGIDNCAFGRGVQPIADDNKVVSEPGTYHTSEFMWNSPDGSGVIGVLFAHWYHNAWEIPAEHDAAVENLKSIIAKTSVFASTPHLLGMNGCDHQPLQVNVGDIIEDVKADFPDVEIRHSNFRDYMAEMRKYKDIFPDINGELYGQTTNGYHTLVNTASARLYMKQANHENQLTLEKQTEPLSVIAFNYGNEYKKDVINFAWKEMLKNHAHDSICGCSVDAVHRECMSRFEKSTASAEAVRDDAIEYIENNMNTDFADAEKVVLVYNPNGYNCTATVTANVDISLDDDTPVENFGIFTKDGVQLACDIKDMGRTFTYVLPKDSFRKVTYYRRLVVTFTASDVNAVGYEAFLVKKTDKKAESSLILNGNVAENEFIKIAVNEDGTFDLTDKVSGNLMSNLGYFEESGDAGNEYNYLPPVSDGKYVTLGKKAKSITAVKNETSVVFTVEQELIVPKTTDDDARGFDFTAITFTTDIVLNEKAKMAEIFTRFNNTAENHRIRIMFPNNVNTDTIFIDGQYDLLERPVDPGKKWVNPDNSQRQQAFVMLKDTEKAIVVANRGLPEYEVLRDEYKTVAVTILRCVWELGDWGVFPTPEAQCIGENKAHLAVGVTGSDTADMRKQAYAFSTGYMKTMQTKPVQKGSIPADLSFVSIDSTNTVISAVKKAEEDDGIIVRFYNPTTIDETVKITLGIDVKKAFITNLNEEEQGEISVNNNTLEILSKAKRIDTIKVIIK